MKHRWVSCHLVPLADVVAADVLLEHVVHEHHERVLVEADAALRYVCNTQTQQHQRDAERNTGGALAT